MRRYNIHFTERQIKELNAQAKKLDIKTAELVRRILDEYLNRK
jgi:hypothetical protein